MTYREALLHYISCIGSDTGGCCCFPDNECAECLLNKICNPTSKKDLKFIAIHFREYRNAGFGYGVYPTDALAFKKLKELDIKEFPKLKFCEKKRFIYKEKKGTKVERRAQLIENKKRHLKRMLKKQMRKAIAGVIEVIKDKK